MGDSALVLWVVYILLLALMWAMPSLMRRTLPFGVRIPSSRANEPVIARELRRYRWRILIAGIAIAAFALALANVTRWSGAIIAAPLLLVVVDWVCYFAAHERIMAVKHREQWYEGLRQGAAADTSFRAHPPSYPWGWALPAIGIWVASLVIGIAVYPRLPDTLVTHYTLDGVANGWAPKSVGSAFSVVIAAAVVTLIIIGSSLLTFRSRQELDVEHPAVSAQQRRVFVRQMAMALCFLAACVNVGMLVVDLMIWNIIAPSSVVARAGLIAPLVGVVGAIVVMVRVGQSGHRIPTDEASEETGLVNRDDDRYWIAGMIYVNRDDPALLVDKRFGIGWTLNFGHPASWVILLVILALALVPAVIPTLSGK